MFAKYRIGNLYAYFFSFIIFDFHQNQQDSAHSMPATSPEVLKLIRRTLNPYHLTDQ